MSYGRYLSTVVLFLSMVSVSSAGDATFPGGRPLLPDPGFEDVQDNAPTGWRIGGRLSTVSSERVRSGDRALRIADTSDTLGSDVLSSRVAVRAGTSYAVRLYATVSDGQASGGLGVYLRFWDADGRELVEAREKQIYRPDLTPGDWGVAYRTFAVPEEAREAAVWLHTFSSSTVTCFVDDVQLFELGVSGLGPPCAWSGGRVMDAPARSDAPVVRWAHGESASLTQRLDPAGDWSGYGAVRFGLHSAKATGSAFMVILQSESPDTEGMDYYSYRVVLDWEGWRDITLPFRELGRARSPVGWQKIDNVQFTASGWGNTPDPEAVLHLEGFQLTREHMTGPAMSDPAFFDALDVDRPELAAVRAAAAAEDWHKARAAFAAHLRGREAPVWTIDWRDHPYRDATVPSQDQDNDPDSWDYYSRFITVDWEGWKSFSLPKEAFKGRTFVEGKGWTGKNPIGWHWIQYISFRSQGWGLTPDPETVLYFDDIVLAGPDRRVVIADFEEAQSPVSGLEATGEQAKGGAQSGKWADPTLTGTVLVRQIPHDWTEFETLDFWLYSEKATGGRIVMVLDSDPPKLDAKAEAVMGRTFSFGYGGKDWPITFDGPIDWAANPTEGPARTHLWNEALNRHFHFRNLSSAYWNTGDERYAAALVEQWLDWIRRNPAPLLTSGNRTHDGSCAWQTLTTGIRLETIWPDALYRCLGSPHMTDDALVTIVKSVADQARHLMRWPSGGNWLTEESMGLFTAGMLFPEFRQAGTWRATAVDRLYRQLDDDVYPDGMQVELAAGYSNWVVSNFGALLERLDLNNLRHEAPEDFLKKYEKMFEYQLAAMMPDGRIPGLNDSGNADVRGSLHKGYGFFPLRTDLLFGATLGAKGTEPPYTSVARPYTGHYVMRSSWDSDAVYMLLDSGPFGYGHQHEDKLTFVLYAYGRQLVLDPGNYSYDRSRWRRYVLSSHGHNTALVDGEGQARRGRRELYVRPKPWDTPTPAGDNAFWETSVPADVVRGTYSDGYGKGHALDVTHTRTVVFVKPDYFLLVDRFRPVDEKQHRYDVLFHLDAAEAGIGPNGLSVTTVQEDAANIAVVPAAAAGLQVRIAKGEDDPVQGWANHPWRPVPTAVYSMTASGPADFACVLYPMRAGDTCPVQSVTTVDTPDAGGRDITVRFADGSSDRVRLAVADTDAPVVSLERFDATGEPRTNWQSRASSALPAHQWQ